MRSTNIEELTERYREAATQLAEIATQAGDDRHLEARVWLRLISTIIDAPPHEIANPMNRLYLLRGVEVIADFCRSCDSCEACTGRDLSWIVAASLMEMLESLTGVLAEEAAE